MPDGASTALNYPGHLEDYRLAPNQSPEKKLLKAKTSWLNYLNQACAEPEYASKLSDFRNAFVRARRESIDKFIQFNETEFGDIGRLHIAAVLLNCEQDFWLDKDWYSQLLDAIVPNQPDDLRPDMLSIITFNYDRSFEFFLRPAFENGFHLSPNAADVMFERIRVIHVYGQLGELNQISYGDTKLIKDAASQISLVRPDEENPRRDVINALIAEAENICFIGFGFASENVLLFNPNAFKAKRVLLATARGLSPNRIAEAKKTFPGIKFLDLSASDLLQSQNIFADRKPPSEIAVRHRPRNWIVTDPPWRI